MGVKATPTTTPAADEDFPLTTRGLCIQLRMKSWGVKRIARELGIDHAGVCRHLQSEEAKAALRAVSADVLDEVRSDFRAWAPEIAQVAYDVAVGDTIPNRGQMDAIKLCLNLAGLAETQIVKVEEITAVADEDLNAAILAEADTIRAVPGTS